VKLVFFGSGAFGLPTLCALSQHHDITAVVSQPDRPAGRKRTLTPTPISQWAHEHAPDRLLTADNVNAPHCIDHLHSLNSDAWVVIAFGQKLKPELLGSHLAMNLHASLLPRWRGAAPIAHTILEGDTTTGNSVITLAQRMDAGNILTQSVRTITPTITAGQLHDALASDGPALVLDVITRFTDGSLREQTQDESAVTLAPKLSRADAHINFNDVADICRRRINAYSPWPGVVLNLSGTRIKALRADCSNVCDSDAKPGSLIDAEQGLLACGAGTTLQLLDVQPQGKRVMSWSQFIRGHRLRAPFTVESIEL